MSATGQLGTAWRKRDYHRQWLWREANRLFDFYQNRAFNPLGGFHELAGIEAFQIEQVGSWLRSP